MPNQMDQVAYKPLVKSRSLSPQTSLTDDEAHNSDRCHSPCDSDEDEDHCQLGLRGDHVGLLDEKMASRSPQVSRSQSSCSWMGLRQLRTILYMIATLLFLLFLAQLTAYRKSDNQKQGANLLPIAAPMKSIRSDSNISAIFKLTSSSSQTNNLSNKLADGVAISNLSQDNVNAPRNSDDNSNHLSTVLNERNFRRGNLTDGGRRPQHLQRVQDDLQVNQSTDNREFHDDGHTHSINMEPVEARTNWWSIGERASNEDKYITITNYIRAMKSFNSSITLTTQATTEFMYHTLELCERWDGPISVAVFCPGPEMLVASTLIKFMRQCLPKPLSACIKDKVTWHLVYHNQHGPPASSIGLPESLLDSKNFPSFVNDNQCPKMPGPNPSDTIKQYEFFLKKASGISRKSYRERSKLTYPINVLRNTARLAAATKYVLASDIELYPSVSMVSGFMNLISEHRVKADSSENLKFPGVDGKYIFTLPIFEVDPNVPAPKTKQELVKLFEKGEVIFFHKYVCDACQNFPNRMDWLMTDKFGLSNYHANPETLVVFEITERNKSHDSWEPIFIGTNEDPLYDDRLTWDGRRDKMGQMYEMCLQDYRLLVLGNAFLVHAPGIKRIDQADFRKRLHYIQMNNYIYDSSMRSLKEKYANKSTISKC